MYHVSAQGADERMINVHYYYYHYYYYINSRSHVSPSAFMVNPLAHSSVGGVPSLQMALGSFW